MIGAYCIVDAIDVDPRLKDSPIHMHHVGLDEEGQIPTRINCTLLGHEGLGGDGEQDGVAISPPSNLGQRVVGNDGLIPYMPNASTKLVGAITKERGVLMELPMGEGHTTIDRLKDLGGRRVHLRIDIDDDLGTRK